MMTEITTTSYVDLIANGYPKSGLTWLIHLLSDTFDLTQHNDPNAEVQGYWGDNGNNGIIRKRHTPNLGQYDKVIHIQRDPRDVMVSAMHYRRHHDFDFALLVFASPIEHEIGGTWTYEEYLYSWINSNHFVTRYEWLHSKPVEELGRIADYIGIEVISDKITQAIERQSFEAMRQQLNDDHFMRLGQVGDWRNHFTREQGEKFNDLLGEFMLSQGYIDSLDWWMEL